MRSGKGKIPPKPTNDRLHYPLEYSWQAFARYYDSNFVALPDEGGFFDQDSALMDDFGVLTEWVNYQFGKSERGKRGGTPKPPPGFDQVFAGKGVTDDK